MAKTKAHANLYPYSDDFGAPAKVLLARVRGESIPLQCAVHASWQMLGATLNNILPDDDSQEPTPTPAPTPTDPAAEPTTDNPPKGSPRKLDNKPKGATSDPEVPDAPPGRKSSLSTPFKGCVPPDQVTDDQVVHCLAQASGERGMQGLFSGEFMKKLAAVAMKLLFDFLTEQKLEEAEAKIAKTKPA